MTFSIEGHARNDGYVDSVIISKMRSGWFHDAKGPRLQAVSTGIEAQLHVGIADDARQQDGLALGDEPVEQGINLYLVGQGAI